HKIKIIANRFIKKGHDIEPADVERTLGLKIAHYVPNDFKTAITAINLGEPFVLRAPKTELSHSIVDLAGLLDGRDGREVAAAAAEKTQPDARGKERTMGLSSRSGSGGGGAARIAAPPAPAKPRGGVVEQSVKPSGKA